MPWEGMYWWDENLHQSGKFSGLVFEEEDDPFIFGPMTPWDAEERSPWIPSMEIYFEFLTEQIAPSENVFTFFWIDDGVGVEGGFKNNPIPIRAKILLNNEFQGLYDYKLIELDAEMKFRAHIEFDEEYVYPEFVDAKIMRPKILHNA